MKHNKKIVCVVFFLVSLIAVSLFSIFRPAKKNYSDIKYFCTCADSFFFPRLLNLIGTIHKVHFDDLGEIAVFNLGFTAEQIDKLNSIQKVKVYDLEMTHPDLLKHVHVGNADGSPGQGRMVRGWYAWKPVVIKQGLDLFPYMLYLDAGCLVMNRLDDLFKHIQKNGYFLVGCGHNIRWMTTKSIIEKFDLLSEKRKWILDDRTSGISAGFQGLTRDVYDAYVNPVYTMSKDLRNFMDDGTCPNGFGTSRHDQPLFSIQASLLGMHVNRIDPLQKNPIVLHTDTGPSNFWMTWDPKYSNDKTHILLQASYFRKFMSFIRYK